MRVAFVLIVIFSLSACVSQDPALTEKIDKLVRSPQSSAIYSAHAQFQPMPLRIGQYTQYKITTKHGEVQSFTLKVLDPGDFPFSYWLEGETLTPQEHKVVRALFMMDDARLAVAQHSPQSFEPQIQDFTRVNEIIRWNKKMQRPMPVPQKNLDSYNFKPSFLDQLKVGKKKSVKVPAGQFKGCFESVSKVTDAFGWDTPVSKLTSCLDASVPLNGIVEATDSQGNTWELVNFGVKGAKSGFPSK